MTTFQKPHLHGAIRLLSKVPLPPALSAVQGCSNQLLVFLSYPRVLNTVEHFDCAQVPESLTESKKNILITVRRRQNLESPGECV